MKHNKFYAFNIFCLFLSSLFVPSLLHGQWISQDIELTEGWNSVYLKVQPEPRQCQYQFKDLPIEGVWCWNPKESPMQYIDQITDPNEVLFNHEDWLVYFPLDKPEHVISNLFTLQGGKCYMIKVSADTAWEYKGKPVLPENEWISGRLNLAGFHIDDSNPLDMAEFWGSAQYHNQSVFSLVNGQWEGIDIFGEDKYVKMIPDHVYVTSFSYSSDFVGPISIVTEQSQGLDFGKLLVKQILTITNHTQFAVVLKFSIIDSESPPDALEAYEIESEPVANEEFNFGYIDDNHTKVVLSNQPISIDVSAGEAKEIEFYIDRLGEVSEGSYQSILQIVGCGMHIDVPVRAEYNGNTGLWVGMVSINKVSQLSDPDYPEELKDTATEFQFPIIVHVADDGEVTFLREVVQLWQEGELNEDGDGYVEGKEPRYVLLTDESHFGEYYSGVGLRDGQPYGRRISSASFTFPEPIVMEGQFCGNSEKEADWLTVNIVNSNLSTNKLLSSQSLWRDLFYV